MNFRASAVTLQLVFTTSLLFCMTTHADVLVLKNGDRITGEIKRVWDGEISIEPEYSDEFKVDVEAVKHIESDRNFDIELDSGESLVAKFSGLDAFDASDTNRLPHKLFARIVHEINVERTLRVL